MATPTLQMRGIHKRFGRTHALKGVDFELLAGVSVAEGISLAPLPRPGAPVIAEAPTYPGDLAQ